MAQKKVQRREVSQGKKRSQTKRKTSKSKKSSKWLPWLYVVLIAIFAILLAFILLGKKGHKGIDISHHQGKINWEQVASEGKVEFAYIKATEGANYVDKLYKHNVSEARKHGVLVAPYHFFRSEKSGKEQFDNFCNIIGNEFDLVPVLDLEELGGKISDREAYRREVQTFIDLFVSHYGYKPFIYGSLSFIRDNVYPVGQDCDFWLAWYLPLSKVIRDKRRFINKMRPGLHPRVWQYSDKGHVPGIAGDVDLDECWELQDLSLRSLP